MQLNAEAFTAILDTIDLEIVFVDNDHIIRFMNHAAKRHYYDRSGYSDLIGKSLFDYHNEVSSPLIREVYARMVNGENEIFLPTEENPDYSMVAVRNEKRELLGYIERNAKRVEGDSLTVRTHRGG